MAGRSWMVIRVAGAGACLLFWGTAQATTTVARTDALTTAVAVETSPTVRAYEPTEAEIERARLIKEAVTADDFRETAGGSPRQFNQLEESTETVRRIRGIANSPVFIPTLEKFAGPVAQQPRGSLSGKLIFMSAGHGWTCDTTTTTLWYTQRPLTHGVVEDFGNIDQLNYFADACWRAGATIIPMRPLGRQNIERVLDNASRAGVGFHGEWFDSDSKVFYGTRTDDVPYRYALASATETAVARYTPFMPEAGYYPVYAWARDGADRVKQTYRIVHAGGVAEVEVNHRRVGKGWVYLGEYYFERGRGGYAEVTNAVKDAADASPAGRSVVIADAIRFGNGYGDINMGGGISGFPREEEASKYWVEASAGYDAPRILYQVPELADVASNVGAPPRMAAYMNRETEGSYFDRIFLSFHTNAVDGRGCVGLYNFNEEQRTDLQVEYAEIVARQTNIDLAAAKDLDLPFPWNVRPDLTISRINFGEIRRDAINNEMNATINEAAFHDHPEDAALILTPNFRRATARAMVRAILNLHAVHDPARPGTAMAPEPPRLVAAVSPTTNTVFLSWLPPLDDPAAGDAPAGYRVYRSRDGHSFDGGVDAGTALTHEVPDAALGEPLFFRVTAVNAGGESAPSRVLGVGRPEGATRRALVVSAFDAQSGDLIASQTVLANIHTPGFPGAELGRVIPRIVNPQNQAAVVGRALAAAGLAFDSAHTSALDLPADKEAWPDVAVVLFGRQDLRLLENREHVVATLDAFHRNGVALVVSGSDVVQGLTETASSPAGARFAREVLGVAHAGVTSQTYTLHGIEPGRALARSAVLDGRDEQVYLAKGFGVLRPAQPAAEVGAAYFASGAQPAFVINRRADKVVAATAGFPLEHVGERAALTGIIRRTMELTFPDDRVTTGAGIRIEDAGTTGPARSGARRGR